MGHGAKKSEPQDELEFAKSILAKLEFFRHFPEELLHRLANRVVIKKFSQGEVILSQGQMNSDLFFLLSGVLSVLVDGGLVAELRRKGDLVGEMSVISRKPAAATIKAKNDSEVLIVASQDIDDLSDKENDGFQQALYRVYAQDLTNKLRITNQKAKYFEDLTAQLTKAQEDLREINRDLEEKVRTRTIDLQKRTEDLQRSHLKLEQQNAELVASHKKMEELYFTRELTFQKLEELYKNSLIPLQMTLVQLEQATAEGAQRDLVHMAGRELSEVLYLLEPVASIYSSQLAMKAKRVLLAEPNMKHQVMAKMALGGTGVALEIVSTLEEGKKALAEKPYDIIFVSVEMLDLCDLAQDLNPLCHTVFMTSDRIDQYLPKLRDHKVMPHIVSRDAEDRTFTIKNIVTSVTKLASGDIFGLSKYLAWGSDVKRAPIIRSESRGEIIASMDKHLSKLGVRRTVRDRASTVLEELLMNAIYDAPVDKNGQPLYNHLSRLKSIELKPEHQGRLLFGTDGMILAISVEDPFGALSGDTILQYLDRCYGGAETGHAPGFLKAGGGRGLHQIIENSDLVVFNLHPGVKTEVIAIFNVDPKDSGHKNPSFHLFTQ